MMQRQAAEILDRLGSSGLTRALSDTLDSARLARLAGTCGLTYPGRRTSSQKKERILKDLYEHVLENPGDLVKPYPEEDSLEMRALDTIAGMTDLYALRLYEELFSPPDWPLI